jgi:hypothetical protein
VFYRVVRRRAFTTIVVTPSEHRVDRLGFA